MRLLKTRRQKVDHVEFNSTGALLAHGYDEVACWLNPLGEEKPFQFSTRYTWGAAFTGLGNQLMVCNGEGVFLVRPEEADHSQVFGEEVRGYKITAAGIGRLLLHASDGSLLAIATEPNSDARRLWELLDEHPSSPPATLNTAEQFVRIEYRSRHGAFFPQLVIRDLITGEVANEWPIRAFSDGRAFTSPNDQWLAHLSYGKWIVILDLATRRFDSFLELKRPDRKHFTDLAFHPSGRFLAATSNDATVKLYDTSNWSLATTFTWDIGRMRSVAFSPDGLLAAAGSDTGRVVVWDVDV